MRPSDLEALTQDHFVDFNVVDTSAIVVSTLEEGERLMEILRRTDPHPAFTLVTALHFEGRSDHKLVIQKNNLVFLCQKLPNVHTLTFTHVACLRPPEARKEDEQLNGSILKRIVINSIYAGSAGPFDDFKFCPLDLVYYLSAFRGVAEVEPRLDDLVTRAEMASCMGALENFIKSSYHLVDAATQEASMVYLEYMNGLVSTGHIKPAMHELQEFVREALTTLCTVDSLVLHGGDPETREAWTRVLVPQRCLELKLVVGPSENMPLYDRSMGAPVVASQYI